MPELGLSPKGRKALRGNPDGGDIAPEHRRVLSLLEFAGATEVVRGFLRRFPDALIDRWLGEVEALQLVERVEPKEGEALRFSGGGAVPVPPLLDADEQRLGDEAWTAGNLLNATGVYVARERAKNRSAAPKDPAATTVLIVEDDPDQRALAVHRVRAARYRVQQADSAQALLEMLTQQAPPDLMLLDVVLPDGDGFDILGSLRRHPRFCLLPVIMLTVKGEPADIRRGIALGADGYVTKPYSERGLVQAIAEALGFTSRGP